MTLELFVLPALRKMMGTPKPGLTKIKARVSLKNLKNNPGELTIGIDIPLKTDLLHHVQLLANERFSFVQFQCGRCLSKIMTS